MSLPVPLSVRLVRTQSGPDAHDRHITAQLRDLTYRAAVPGGFTSARLSLHRSLALPPEELAHYARVIVYDNAAQVMWEGRLEDPARSAGGDGEMYDLTAIGPAGHTRDRTVPLVYVSKLHTDWRRQNTGTNIAARVDIGDTVDMAIPRGTVVPVGFAIRAVDQVLEGTGLMLGRVAFTWQAGNSDTNHRMRLYTRPDGGAASQVYDAGWTTTPMAVQAARGGSPAIPSGHAIPELTYERATSQVTITDDVTYQRVTSVVVRQLLKDAAGVDITSGYTADTVLASDVVKDLLGRLLTHYDGAGATIATTTHPIDQLAYPDGVTAEKVLGDLATLEPGHYWVAWESNTAGKHRFEYIPWPTSVTYETSVDDVASFPSSATELFDKVRVRWRDVDGKIRTVQRTQTVQALTDAGITREDFLDLGDEIGSQANAERAGDQHLAEHATAANRGTLTVARPIYSTALGRMVPPWELPRRLPGSLIRVRGVTPNVNALNATTHNAVTVFRVVSAEFNASSMSTQLELDTFQPTIARTVARIAKQPVTRRR